MAKEKTKKKASPKSTAEPKVKDVGGTTRKLINYLKPFRGKLLIVFLFVVLSTAFSVLGPQILGYAVDILYEGVSSKLNGAVGSAIDYKSIITILLILLGTYLASSLFSYILEYRMASIAHNLIRQMRDDVDRKLHRLPLNYFDTKAYGDILSRVTNDIDTISVTFEQSLVQIITAAISLLGIAVMMFIISPMLSVIAILILPLSALIASWIGKKSQPLFEKQQATLGDLNGYVEEMYGGHAVVKAFNYEERAIKTFEETNQQLYTHGWKSQFLTSIIYPLLNFFTNIAFIAICVLGGYLTAMGRITLGEVQAFISYSRQFGQPIMQLSSIVNVFMATIAAAERVFEVLDEPEEIPDSSNPQTIKDVRGNIELKNIYFNYRAETPLIENLSVNVKSGSIVAIVGPTGAGKSTLVNLLMRFYEPQQGEILIDGVKTTDMTRGYLHSLIGMVLQDTWLFNGTIADNIAYGKEGASKEEIKQAAKIAYADSFVRTFPKGYSTCINEDADNVSQGQKQLLTIARAVIANPKILILDEATSSVDTRTEVLIQKAMRRLMQGRTSFVIAHRLSTIRDADTILVMDKGQIVEQGTHSELLSKKGFYANLYQSQFSED